jgi:hypothetical protein
MLKGNLGVWDLIRAAKQAYLRAAIAQLFPAGSRVNASRLSVATGLTRKEVAALVSRSAADLARNSGTTKYQRAFRVLRGWMADPRFRSNAGGPAALPLRGERRSFSLLVKLYGGDVTPNAVLRELERMNAVRFARSGTISLRRARHVEKPTQRLAELARVFGDLANTTCGEKRVNATPFFGFRDCIVRSSDQVARFQRIFSTRAAAVLEGADQWFASQRARATPSDVSGSGQRVGIGVYLIKESGEEDLLRVAKKRRR